MFFKAVFIGFLLSVPIGPVNLLCIRRTMVEGRLPGFISGIGAAVADTFFAYVAAYGVNFIINFIVKEEVWLRLAGGAFLCCLGLRSYLSHPPGSFVTLRKRGLLGCCASTFLLTLTNPVTLVAFAAAFAGFGVALGEGSRFSPVLLVAGVFTGSSLWWFTLTGISSSLSKKFSSEVISLISRVSGVAIAIFGIIMILTVFYVFLIQS